MLTQPLRFSAPLAVPAGTRTTQVKRPHWAVALCLAAAGAAGFGTAAQAATTFDLNEIRVDGSTVLPQEQVEETVYPFLGPGKSADDVEAARKALQDAYT